MCGRFALTTSAEKLKNRFKIQFDENYFKPNLNIAPSQIIPIITQNNPQTLTFAKWGLVPFFSKDLSKGIINARVETITQKPAFKKSFQSKRCLIPASFFYEWKKESKQKIPYKISLENEELFAFAGIYEEGVMENTGEILITCTIITTETNEIIKPIHDRMPVVPVQENKWINPDYDQVSLIELLKSNKLDNVKIEALSRVG